jgi:hypothetical protein
MRRCFRATPLGTLVHGERARLKAAARLRWRDAFLDPNLFTQGAGSLMRVRSQGENPNVRVVPAFLALALLGGCSGYASDYWKPKERLIAPQLPRYGLSTGQAQCVEAQLTKGLSVWQLRQLGDLAGRLGTGGNNPGALAPRDFLYVSGLVKDPKVKVATERALESCSVTTRAGAAQPPSPASPPPTSPGLVPGAPVVQEPAAAARPALWVNLGTAPTGQAISVDASSLVTGPSGREAWFRLTNPGAGGVGDIAYRLRIDCAAKSITALGGRKYSQTGALLEQKDYPTPEGPLPIEAGTVMELAFRGVCT